MGSRQLVKDYLDKGNVMQLATTSDSQPWVCTVYYVPDDEMNLYWLSFPSRRHSMEIMTNHKLAVTVVIKNDRPVIGVQAEGRAEVVSDSDDIKFIMKKYVKKYDEGHEFYKNFLAGKNKHQMYKFTPSAVYLFDENNFPHDSPVAVNL